MLLIGYLAVGCLIGELIRIEGRLHHLAGWAEKRFSASGEGLSKGFVTTTLLFCVGSMAIVGSLESGLEGKHDILFAKSVLDGIVSVIFSATLVVGVIFSTASVFLYQGAITLGASFLKQCLTPETIAQMSAVGGVIIIAMGFNMLNITRVRVGNLLPAIFLPPVTPLLQHFIARFL